MSSLPTELDFAANPAATPLRMNLAMSYLIARFKAMEALAPGINEAIDTVKSVGLDRITEVLQPLAEQANGIVDDLATIKALWEDDHTYEDAVAATTAAVTASFADYRSNYLGAHASAPTVTDDGTPVAVGCMYFDTSLDQMLVLGAAGWKNAGSSVAGVMRQLTPIIATAGQTAFTIVGGYDVGYLILTVNGVMIPPADYTATNGTSVTLVAALSAGDELGGVAFGALTLSNVYTKAAVDAGFAAIDAAYTKAAADARYALTTDAYNKAASDARYAKNDLSNLSDAAAARSNLGIGVAGTRADSYFAKASNNLSDLSDAAAARSNLGLKLGSVVNVTVSTTAPSSPAEGDVWINA